MNNQVLERPCDNGARPGGGDKLYRALAASAAYAGLFAYAVLFTITPAAINEIKQAYDVPESILGIIFLLFALGFAVSVLVGGRVSDRRGKLPLLLIGALIMALGSLIFCKVNSFAVVLWAMLLMGIGGGVAEGISTALVADLYSDHRRTMMLNFSQVFFAVGAVSAPLAMAAIIRAGIDWRVGYIGAVAVCMAAAFAALGAMLMRKEKPLLTAKSSSAHLLKNPIVFWLSIGIMLYVGAECGQANWLARYFQDMPGVTGAFAALTIAIFWAGISVGRAVASLVSRRVHDTLIILWALGMGAIFQGLLILLRSPIAAVVMVFLLGCTIGPVWPTILSRAGKAFPLQTGTVFGILVAMGAMGEMIFPPVIGWIAGHTGFRIALSLCFVLLIVNFAIFVRMRMQET